MSVSSLKVVGPERREGFVLTEDAACQALPENDTKRDLVSLVEAAAGGIW